LRLLVESSGEKQADARQEARFAQTAVATARAKNAALSKDLALAREELLAAREDLNVSPARARRNRERAPRRGAPARGEGQGGLRPGNGAAETFGAGRAENA